MISPVEKPPYRGQDRGVENAARNGMKRWLGSDPWPKAFAVFTVAAFIGAYTVFDVRPWGPWCAGALTVAWAIFVIVFSTRQARLEGASPFGGMSFRERLVRRPVAAILQIVMVPAWISVGGLLLWLHHIDAPRAQIDVATAAFWTLMVAGWILEIVVDSIYHHLERRRLRAG
jgi:hypothetical protein